MEEENRYKTKTQQELPRKRRILKIRATAKDFDYVPYEGQSDSSGDSVDHIQKKYS